MGRLAARHEFFFVGSMCKNDYDQSKTSWKKLVRTKREKMMRITVACETFNRERKKDFKLGSVLKLLQIFGGVNVSASFLFLNKLSK